MGALADRLGYLARRYGSHASAWQHEIAAVAALEKAEPREALERFHALKRRFAEFRRLQLLDELRAYAFIIELPPRDTKGWESHEIEADIRAATKALSMARSIATALQEAADARASLQVRTLPEPIHLPPTRWDALEGLAADVETDRRHAAREARLDRRLVDAQRRARRVGISGLPDPLSGADALDMSLDTFGSRLDEAEELAQCYHSAIEPLRAPEVATYRGESKRVLEREAQALRERTDAAGLHDLLVRTEALRKEAAALASQAVRSRRKGLAVPERERRSSDTMDGYG
jgi:hypothetical protein